MIILDNFKDRLNDAAVSAFSINSMREYLLSTKDKLMDWLSRESPDPQPQRVNVKNVEGEWDGCLITYQQYCSVLLDPSLILDIYSLDDILCHVTASDITSQISYWPQLSPTSAEDYLQIGVPYETGKQLIGLLSYQQYYNCLYDIVESIDIPVSDGDATITLTKDQVLELVEDLSVEAVAQSEFLGYCIENENVNAQDFIQTVRAKTQFISSGFLEKYASLLENGDALTAISGYFSTVKNFVVSEITEDNHHFVQIEAQSDYTGISVLTLVVNKLSSAAIWTGNLILKGIQKFIDLSVAITAATYQLGKSILKFLAKRYFTRYTTTTKSYGMLDVPILQFAICGLSDLSYNPEIRLASQKWIIGANYLANLGVSANAGLRYGAQKNGNVVTDIIRQVQSWGNTNWWLSLYRNSLCTVIDDNNYVRPADVFLPNPKDPSNGLILRFGIAEKEIEVGYPYSLTFQVFGYFSKAWLELRENDKAIAEGIHDVIVNCIDGLTDIFPILNPYGPSGDYSVSDAITYLHNHNIMSAVGSSEPDDNTDLVIHFSYFEYHNNCYSDTSALSNPASFLNSLRIIFGGLIPYWLLGADAVVAKDQVCLDSDYYTSWATTPPLTPTGTGWDQLVTLPDVIERGTYYLPFTQRSLCPIIAHYQTSDEVANEWIQAIIAVAIVTAAIVIAVKWNQFKKRRLIKAELAAGYADNMSWTLSSNPTKEELRNYWKARKRANKISNLNGILGLSSSSDTVNMITTDTNDLMDKILGLKGVNASEGVYPDTDINLQSIIKLIKN